MVSGGGAVVSHGLRPAGGTRNQRMAGEEKRERIDSIDLGF